MPTKPNTQKRKRNVQKGLQEAVPVDPHESDELKTALEKCESMFRKILDSVDPQKVQVTSTNDLYKVSTGLAGIVKARIELERWEVEKRGIFEEVRDWFRDAFWITFQQKYPEVAEKANEILLQAAEQEERRLRGEEPKYEREQLPSGDGDPLAPYEPKPYDDSLFRE